MGQVHHDWLAKVGAEIAEDYERLHAAASKSSAIQQSGHGGESTWVRFFTQWLPSHYGVGTRKYIVPEEGGETFETDIVIFQPGYPVPLRHREEVLAGGIAAAFSVKLTLDASSLREAATQARDLRRPLKTRFGSPRSEMLPPFPFGVLSHSHTWKQPASTPIENVTDALWELDNEMATHPREQIDMVCVADLCAWNRIFMPHVPPHPARAARLSPTMAKVGNATTAMVAATGPDTPSPVAVLLGALYGRLSINDPSLKPISDGLLLTGTTGSGSGPERLWELSELFSDQVLEKLPVRGLQQGDNDWGVVY